MKLIEKSLPLTAKQRRLRQPQAYLLGLDATMKFLAGNPRMARAIDDIREGYFKFPTASHILIYRLKPGAIEFVRILHKSSDVERHV